MASVRPRGKKFMGLYRDAERLLSGQRRLAPD